MKLSEVIHEVTRLANIVDQENQAASPGVVGFQPGESLLRGPSAAEKNLEDYIRQQPVAVIYTLALIMYAGRGDFPITDFLEQYQEMNDTFDSPARAIDQMTEKNVLAEYLEDGLKLLKGAQIDVDELLA
jgi:hypothetical protein